MLIDSHSHIYLKDFDDDRDAVVQRAVDAGIVKIVLPNVDGETIEQLLSVSNNFPGICFPLMGLHPTSVNADYKKELEKVELMLDQQHFYGIGEIGIDLYWDKTFKQEQIEVFRHQIRLAKSKGMPIVIHVRNSFEEVFEVVEKEQDGALKGIFHCFSGNVAEANKIIALDFKIGIGGVVTFKNSNLREVLQHIDISHLVLETDSPYLAPVPFRGKRNETAYLRIVAENIAEVYSLPFNQVAKVTSSNVEELFGI